MPIMRCRRAIAAAILVLAVAGAHSTQAGKIYWGDGFGAPEEILRAELDGTNIETIVTGNTYGLAVDAVDRKIYWGQGSEAVYTIRRANLNGTGTEVLYDVLGFGPLYIALDRDRGKFYVSMAGFEFCGGLHRFDMYDTGGDGWEPLNADCILGITVDAGAAKLYWTETEPQYRIRRADLDASNAETLLVLNARPGGIDLDPAGGKIYWTQQSTDHILRADLDGSNPEVVVSDDGFLDMGIALDLRSRKLYWTHVDVEERRILRADLDGENAETILVVNPHGQIDIDPIPDGPNVPAASSVGLAVLLLVMLGVSAVAVRRTGAGRGA